MIVFLPFLRNIKRVAVTDLRRDILKETYAVVNCRRGVFWVTGHGMSLTWKRGQSKNSKQWRDGVSEKDEEGHEAIGGTTDP